MLSATLNRASRSARARKVVESASLTRRVVDRFVAGEDASAAVAAARDLSTAGKRFTIDLLGEDVVDVEGARTIRSGYTALLWELAEAGLADGADVSLKLSALGQGLPKVGRSLAAEHAQQVCAAAQAVGATVSLDMEDHTTVDSTLAIGNELRREYPSLATVLQSNLTRTPGDIAMLANSGARVRLVKGAYNEPASVAHQRKADVDEAYCRDIAQLMASTCYPMIGTHDPRMIEEAAAAARLYGRSTDAWELQMLYGVRSDLQDQGVSAGRTMRIYIPYGSDWYGYFMRRLAERPANVAFFLRALTR
ncbi:MAG TPA: proline dehydrogenase family protein [Marmoricola sp.]|jgi:proline dehydrogenase|nr:proline dehydrogenase family protein [Marmoricola sp.]